MTKPLKLIVIDDDPTGSQTVHSCLLLTQWDHATLREAMVDDSPLFFILTNTRGVDGARAGAITREVCQNLRDVLASLDRNGLPFTPVIVSRSDSTLRGHYPLETDIIAQELGPFDGHFLVPAFFEGGRITRDGMHYVVTNGNAVEAHNTEFARDSVFGYSTAYLPAYVEEKTRGRIRADDVVKVTLEDIRSGNIAKLLALEGNRCCAVDAETQADLDRFAGMVGDAMRQGKRFLFRSAASLLTAFAALPPQPVSAQHMSKYRRENRAGAFVVGSHVGKTTQQLENLLKRPGTVGIEVPVDRLEHEADQVIASVLDRIHALHRDNVTPVIYTSRGERQFSDHAARLAFGERISECLVIITARLPVSLGFLVAKGGITSHEVLRAGLELRAVRVLGQILPGCSVVQCPADHPRFPLLPVVIFPGNVGDEFGLATVYDRFS